MKKKGIILQYHYIPINRFKIFTSEDKYITDKTLRFHVVLDLFYLVSKLAKSVNDQTLFAQLVLEFKFLFT